MQNQVQYQLYKAYSSSAFLASFYTALPDATNAD